MSADHGVPAMKQLIVNADDFGRSEGVNRGIVEAHERGIVTSASLMVRFPDAVAAAEYARSGSLGVGLHVDLSEWTHRDGEWMPVYERIDAEDAEAVEHEVRGQLEVFRRLLRREPTHVDSHHHVHRDEPARSIVCAVGAELGVPVRHFGAVRYIGDFYGQERAARPYPEGITVETLLRLLRELPAGVSELGCHPGHVEGLESTYLHEREVELRTLCDPVVRAACEAGEIELRTF